MATTDVLIDAIATELAGKETFILEGLCQAAGDLPDVALFVYEIVIEGDRTQDVFTRVANMSDLEELETDRGTAIINGSSYWRRNYFRKEYFDLEEAVGAKLAFEDRVHLLTQDYENYADNFYDDTVHSFPYPAGYQTNVSALTDAFYAAYDTYDTTKVDEAAAQDALNAAQAAIAPGSPAYARYSFAQTMVIGLSLLKGHAVTGESRFGTLVGASDGSNCEWFRAKVDAYLVLNPDVDLEANSDTFNARVLAERNTGGAEFNQSTADHAAQKALADAEMISAEADRDSLTGVISTAQSALTNATAAKADAWAALMSDPDSAYSELVACCPDFEVGHGYDFPPTP